MVSRTRGIRHAPPASPLVALALAIAIGHAAPLTAAPLPDYAIDGVPDFDQVRNFQLLPFRVGLPANDPNRCSGDPSKACADDGDCGLDDPCIGTGGGMYCFPTSAMNWMAYLASNGYPAVAPGPAADWESMNEYNRVGDAITVMGDGDHMETRANRGTEGEKGRAGLQKWLEPQAHQFAVIRIARQGAFCPRLEHLAAAGLSGQLVIVGVGYYNLTISGGGEVQYERDGGHLMSLARAKVTTDPRELWYRNPSTSSSESTVQQSGFGSGKAPLTPTAFVFDGFARTQDRLANWSSRPTFIDAYTAICPVFVATPGEGTLRKVNPVPVPPVNQPLVETYANPPGADLVDGALLSSFTAIVLITEGGAPEVNRLWHLDLVTSTTTEVPLPGEPRRVASGRSPVRPAYVLDDAGIHGLGPDLAVIATASVPAGTVPDALAYDDASDEVLLLSTATGELLRYPQDLATTPTSVPLPAAIAPTAGADLFVGPAGEEIWIADPGAAAVHRLVQGAGGGLVVAETVMHPSLTSPDAIAVNDAGQLVISNAGSLLELERGPAGGWQAAADPLFTGHASGGFLDIVRSRTNFDPATMTGPPWRNVLPIAVFGESAVPAVSTAGLAALAALLIAGGAWMIGSVARGARGG